MLQQLKKFSFISLLALSFLSFSTTSIADDSTSYTRGSLKGATVKIGLSTVPPFVIVDSQKYTEPVGVDVEILREIQNRLGFSLPNNKFVYTSSNDKYKLITDGQVDIIAGGISATPQRNKLFDFSPSYYHSSFALVIHKDNKNIIKDIHDMNNRTVSVEYGNDLSSLVDGVSFKQIDVLTAFSCFYAVAHKDVDGTIYDLPTTKYYERNWKDGNLLIAGEPFGKSDTSRIVFLYNKNFKYKDEFNAVLNEMIKDGTVDKIMSKFI